MTYNEAYNYYDSNRWENYQGAYIKTETKRHDYVSDSYIATLFPNLKTNEDREKITDDKIISFRLR